MNLYLTYEAYNNEETELLSQSQPQDREELHKQQQQKQEAAEATEGTRQGNTKAPPLYAYICRKIFRLKEVVDTTNNEQQQQAENDTTQVAHQQQCRKYSLKEESVDNILPVISPIANNSSITVQPDNKHPAATDTDEIAQRQQINRN